MRKQVLAGLVLGVFSATFGEADESLTIGEKQSLGENGTMVICQSERKNRSRNLYVHFHGAVSVVAENFAKADLNGILVVINFPGLSSAYSKPFQKSENLFTDVLDATAREAGIGKGDAWSSVGVSSFSAGYGAVRELIKSPQNFDRIDAILALDSMYASLEPGIDRRHPLASHMEDYLKFSKLASERRKTFIITHSAQPTNYASTTETASYLLKAIGVERKPAVETKSGTVQLRSKGTKGNFTVLGFEGTTGEAHMLHLRKMHLWLPRIAFPTAEED